MGLMTTKGTPIVGKFLRKGDAIEVGSVLEFTVYTIKVIKCVLSPHVNRAASVPELMQMSGSDSNPMDQGWHVTYSTHRDLWRGRMKSYDGSLFFSAKHNWMLLKDARGAIVGRRGIKSTDNFSLGSKISFPNHVIRLGPTWPVIQKNTDVGTTDSAGSSNMGHSNSIDGGGEEYVHIHQVEDQVLPSSAVFDVISMKLDFSSGYKFKNEIKKRFGSTVHPLGKSNHFLIVVSFGRATFKLHEDVVGIALESCIGGNCDDLSVKYLNDRVFRFFVSSKAVGFMVNALGSFSCS
jgi:hypothetical protein